MGTRTLALLLAAALFLTGCSAAAPRREDVFHVVASFYPMWVLAANVVGDVPGIELSLLTPPDSGCPHHYQLLPQDMKKLEGANLVILNGADMEHFLEGILEDMPELATVDTSAGLDLLEGGDHGVNPHVWLDVDNAIAQTEAIRDALMKALPQHAAALEENARAYCARLEALKAEMAARLSSLEGTRLVTSHDAFDYLARAFDLTVAAVIQPDGETEPSAAAVGRVCDLMRTEHIPALFLEPDTDGSAPGAIARETGARLVTLDPVTSGEMTPDAYEKAQRANAQILAEVLS